MIIRNVRFLIFILYGLFLVVSFPSCVSPETINNNTSINAGVEPEKFGEIWVYLMRGEENEVRGDEPISDLCYFSAEVNYRGELVGPTEIPSSVKIKKGTRVHLVVADISNTALMHFTLSPRYPVREKLIASIVNLSKKYDGVQIDFESVHIDDRDNYISFLIDCRNRLGSKIFSVALPPRREFYMDPYDYEKIGQIADRIIVMAYDEHWSTSEPGPIASKTWCSKVAQYVRGVVPQDKLVMGLPFYGRAWQDKSHARSLKNQTADELIRNRDDIKMISKEYPSFSYEEKVRVNVFYENTSSIMEKVSMYKTLGFRSIGFWRIGQNSRDIWKHIDVEAPR
jgi:spore germination protein